MDRQRVYGRGRRGYQPPVPKYTFHTDMQDLGTTRPERFRESLMKKLSGKTASAKPKFDYRKIEQPEGPLPPPWEDPRFYNLSLDQQRTARGMYTKSLKIQAAPPPPPEPARARGRGRSRAHARSAPVPEPEYDYEPEEEEYAEPAPSLSVHALAPAPRAVAPPAAPATAISPDVSQKLEKFEQAIRELNQANQVVYAQLWQDDGLRVYRNLPGEGKAPEVIHTYQKGSHWVKLKHPLKRLTGTGDTYMRTEWVNQNDAAVCNGWVRVVEGSTRDIPFSAYSAFPRDDASEARLAYLEKTVEQLTETLSNLSGQLLQSSLGHAPAPAALTPAVPSIPDVFAAAVPVTTAAAPAVPATTAPAATANTSAAPRSYFKLPSMPAQS